MASKWTNVLYVAVFVVVVALIPAARAEASCSGDDCGCYIERDQCIAECPPLGEAGHDECVRACIKASVRCAVCCCCECYECPLYCGGGLSAQGAAPSPGYEPLLETLPQAADECVKWSPGDETTAGRCVPAPGAESPSPAHAPAETVGQSR